MYAVATSLHHLFPYRTNPERNGFQESFQIQDWQCQQDKSIEQVKYDSIYPNRSIKCLEYEGWRRHVESRQEQEGIRIILHVRTIKIQATLARMIDDIQFNQIGWLEPIRAVFEDPILGINFCEKAIEKKPHYIDDFFKKINELEPFPAEIVADLKCVIAFNGAERFINKMIEEGNLKCQ